MDAERIHVTMSDFSREPADTDEVVPLMTYAKSANDRARRLGAAAIVSVAFLAGGCVHPPSAGGGSGEGSFDMTKELRF